MTAAVLPALLSVKVVVLQSVCVVCGGGGGGGGGGKTTASRTSLLHVTFFCAVEQQHVRAGKRHTSAGLHTIKSVNQGLECSCWQLRPPMQQVVHTTAGQSKRYYCSPTQNDCKYAFASCFCASNMRASAAVTRMNHRQQQRHHRTYLSGVGAPCSPRGPVGCEVQPFPCWLMTKSSG